jgi:OmpA-OmpF porin, OOP family
VRAKRPRRYEPLLLGLAMFAVAGVAHAGPGFALDRFHPAESGGPWFAAEGLEFSGHERLAFGMVADIASEPLVARDATGKELTPLIASQSFVHAGASLILHERWRVGVLVPLLAHQRTSALEAENVRVAPEAGAALGDLRLGADVRLLGAPYADFSLAAGIRLYLPTGDRDAFASDGALRALPQLSAAGELGAFVYALATGVQVRRGARDLPGEGGGAELDLTAALGVRVFERRLLLGPELWGASSFGNGARDFLSRASTPFEVVVGAHYDVKPDLRLAFGIGPGLSQGLGAPALRGLLAIEWAPQTAPEVAPDTYRDGDGDGVIDVYDRCPNTFGERVSEPMYQGCPARAPVPAPAEAAALVPADRDHDGVLDGADACPGEPGLEDRVAPEKSGCPVFEDPEPAPEHAPEAP